MKHRRTALVATIAAALVAAPAASADVWNGNTFQSPSGNLVCKWRPTSATLACGSYASQKIVAMTPSSRPVQGRYLDPTSEQAHLLPYGWTWHTQGYSITCSSLFSGMRCVNRQGWSFKIYRQGFDVSFRGAYMWSI